MLIFKIFWLFLTFVGDRFRSLAWLWIRHIFNSRTATPIVGHSGYFPQGYTFWDALTDIHYDCDF